MDLTDFNSSRLAKLPLEQAKVVMEFEKFQHSGFSLNLFTPKLYNALSLYCGFIAHYDRFGFYEARFSESHDMKMTRDILRDWKFYHDATRTLVQEIQYSASINDNLWEARMESLRLEEIQALRAQADKLERGDG